MRRAVLGSLVLLASSSLLAQHADIPVTNWTVPPYTQSSSGGITPMTDATPPRAFIGVQPCRLVDTRAGSGFPAGFGAPSLSPGVPRNFDLDNGPCPGLPVGIEAYSLNITVTTTAGPGHLVIYPQGGAQPDVSSINYVAGQTIANAVIVPAGTGGGVTVVAGVSGTNLLIDINGYFSDTLGNPANSLLLVNNSPGGATAFFNNSSSVTNSSGVYGLVGPSFPRPSNYAPAGARGDSVTNGVLGVSQQLGVAGSLLNGAGAEVAYGILGFWFAGEAQFANTAGVFGQNYSPFGTSAGVYGVDNGGFAGTAGVRGASVNGRGVSGRSRSQGVVGENLDNLDALKTAGYLGFNDTVGVHSDGTITATGVKSFVEPHPTDPTKEIVYVALEGREAGTYFRGKRRLQRGVAVIDVPDDFRMVTGTEGLSIQVTPIGEMATVAVVSLGLDRIVVKGSRDVEFFYTVNGVREAFRDHAPIAENTHYVPQRAEGQMPGAYAPAQRRRLIATGIYNEDGTANVDTARRLGWDRAWAERERSVPSPAPE